jgi:7-cyano-7-deazaguanine synthase in queuosine biosynthesis
MPRREHLVLCGGIDQPQGSTPGRINLNLHGASANVRLRIADISGRLLTNLPDVLVDLLEVASYVYAADAAVSRGGKSDAQMGASWRRSFRFVIPVRQPDLWSSNAVLGALTETLSFLSDDTYVVEFRHLEQPPAIETYFEFPAPEETGFIPDDVILFSGGLDSCAGAVEQLQRNKKIALVSHRSSSKIVETQKYLVDQLRTRFGANSVLHVPIWATLASNLGIESAHRLRSFLFAVLGAATARLFGKDRLCFFENGVVSLNLPPVGQVVGTRATRTTHPQALAGLSRVLSAVLDQPFILDNPFTWLTKSEVIEKLSANGCGDLIRDTRSCTRVRDMTKLHPHCGQCSQCLDRRFAVLAAGQEQEDPEEAYKIDLFLGDREAGPDREMALAFVRSASKVNEMTDVAFFAHYGETSRVVGFFQERADTVAGMIFDLCRRHASTVCRVFDEAVRAHAADFRRRKLPVTCLLSLVTSQQDGKGVVVQKAVVVEQAEMVPSEIRIAIDEKARRVTFNRWGPVTGKLAGLIVALATSFVQAMDEKRAPENYPFIKTTDLMSLIGYADDEALRKCVQRFRTKLTRLAESAGDPPPSIDAVLENIQWHGYRLNPNRVRIVALSEIPDV